MRAGLVPQDPQLNVGPGGRVGQVLQLLPHDLGTADLAQQHSFIQHDRQPQRWLATQDALAGHPDLQRDAEGAQRPGTATNQ